MIISSTAFSHNGEIPAQHTCEGANVSPQLRIEGVPSRAKSLVLLVDDPDAPDPAKPKMTWVHWVLCNIPPKTREIPSGGTAGMSGQNSWGKTGYGGPCPPIGKHRYFFRLFALDCELDLDERATETDVLLAMEGHVLAKTELVGTYEKHA